MLKRQLKTLICIVLCGMMSNPALAAEHELVLSPTQQAEILSEFSKLLSKHYVVPENVRGYVDALEYAKSKGEFSSRLTADNFVVLVNELLQATYPDKHLALFGPEKFRQVKLMFYGDGDEESNDGHEAPKSHGEESAAPGHARPHSGPTGHAQTREDKARKSLSEIGVGRVSEISRDGLNQIGYLELSRFDASPKSRAFIDRVFSTFTESDGIVIDLRNCGGGDADMVKTLSSYFFDKPTHLLNSVFPLDENGERLIVERWTQPSTLSSEFSETPLRILISHDSFSAAESFAYGMQIRGRAELVGETTGGGGYMNDFFDLPFSLGASISVGRAFDPKTGKGWQGVGVIPDRKVERDHALITALNMFTVESGKLAALLDEERVIYDQMQSYTNAWYGADAVTMQRLLADDFLGIYANQAGSERQRYSQQQLVKQTAEGEGVRADKIYYSRIIRDIELNKNTAAVTLILRETVHRMKLKKIDDGWQISEDVFSDKVHG